MRSKATSQASTKATWPVSDEHATLLAKHDELSREMDKVMPKLLAYEGYSADDIASAHENGWSHV